MSARPRLHWRLAAHLLAGGIQVARAHAQEAPVLSHDPRLSQRPALVSCDVSRAPVGLIRGEADVQFILTASGVADTVTVAVLRSNRVSSTTASSASRRLLPTCRFTPGEINQQPVATVVSLRIEFNKLEITVKDGRIAPRVGFVSVAGSAYGRQVGDSAFQASDRRVEEKPVRVQCPQPVAESYDRAPVRASADLLDYSSRSQSPVRIAMMIGVDGRVVPGSVRVVNSIDASMEARLSESVLNCIFVPGRIDGVPVRSWVTETPWDFTPKP